jgi:hypothetical protein
MDFIPEQIDAVLGSAIDTDLVTKEYFMHCASWMFRFGINTTSYLYANLPNY